MIDISSEVERFKYLNENGPDGDRNVAYNRVLDRIRLGGYDVAILELRGIIRDYPDFTEARILLGLCLMAMEKYEESYAEFEYAVRQQPSGIMALRYIDSMVDNGIRVGDIGEGYRSVLMNRDFNLDNLPRLEKEKRIYLPAGALTGTWAKQLAFFAIGCVITFFVTTAVFTRDDGRGFVEVTPVPTAAADELADQAREIKKLTTKVEELTQNVYVQQSEVEYWKTAARVYTVGRLFDKGEYEEAMTMLESVKALNVRIGEDDYLEEVIYGEKLPAYMKDVVAGMDAKVAANDLEGAYPLAKEAVRCGSVYGGEGTLEDYDKALYTAGLCAEAADDMNAAERYYKTIVDSFAEDSRYYSLARDKLTVDTTTDTGDITT